MTSQTCSCLQEDQFLCNINKQKENALGMLFPQFSSNNKCVLMLLSNIAEPDWLQVDCSDHVLGHVVCSMFRRTNAESAGNKHFLNLDTCIFSFLKHNDTCFSFLWVQSKGSRLSQNICLEEDLEIVLTFHVSDWTFLLDAVKPAFPPILVPHNLSQTKQIIFRKYSNMITYTSHWISHFRTQGFVVCSKPVQENQQPVSHILFRCDQGSFVSQYHKCDDMADCSADLSDEAHCTCDVLAKEKVLCRTVKHGNKSACGPLYFRAKEGNCRKHISKEQRVGKLEHNIQKVFVFCQDGSVIDGHRMNDVIPDCETADDEPELLALLVNNTIRSCENTSELPCLDGHSKCFSIHDICVYQIDHKGDLYPCRNGAHVQNCKNISCNKRFKCSMSYCISWTLVCNGKWSCLFGNDENINDVCNKGRCTGMFLCKSAQHICIPLFSLCDDNIDCPIGDDELMCDLFAVSCPAGCVCLAYALHCYNISQHFKNIKFPFLFLAVFGGLVKDLNMLNEVFGDLAHVILQNSQIEDICGIFVSTKMVNTTHINFSGNIILYLGKLCFENHCTISDVSLSNNKIGHIKTLAFYHLLSLSNLDLSHNPLDHLAPYFLVNSRCLKMLNIVDTGIHHFDPITFKVLDAKVVITENYKICCVTHTETTCDTYKPWYVSCSDLLPTEYFRQLFIVVSILISLLNISSCVGQIATGERNSFLIAPVNITDLLCGIYLATIWIADVCLEGIFVVKEIDWRSSVTCHFAFALVIVYTINIQFVLLILSLSRMMIVLKPISTHLWNHNSVVKLSCLCFTISFLGGSSLTAAVAAQTKSLPFALCLPLVDPEGCVQLIKYFVWFTLLSQTLTSGAIVVMHILLLTEIKRTSKIFKKTRTRVIGNVILLGQLVLITASNILCWLPANIVFFVSMLLDKYPTDLVIWTTVGVLPLNAVVNPGIFIAVAVRKSLLTRKTSTKKVETKDS